MSLDVKYRPQNYSDVLGQEATIQVLKEFVRQGKGFQQSYLFCGGHGSGKTTLGRILARALLCEAPNEGEPCGQCHSCESFASKGTHADFTEIDAATNSGKADVKEITDLIQYDTFSGKRRIYLFDESHQLSRDALDALLKPLEDNIPGSSDKKLVCIFCTTEPERMRATVLSRCAPAFVVQAQTPEVIAQRLAYVCEQEGIEYEQEVLQLISQVTGSHIRDALKAVEGISMLGAVDRGNAARYLHLDLNQQYIELIRSIGQDTSKSLEMVRELLARNSPGIVYTKIVETCLMAYQQYLGIQCPSFWDERSVKKLGEERQQELLEIAKTFSSRPSRATSDMLLLDVAMFGHINETQKHIPVQKKGEERKQEKKSAFVVTSNNPQDGLYLAAAHGNAAAEQEDGRPSAEIEMKSKDPLQGKTRRVGIPESTVVRVLREVLDGERRREGAG